MLSYFLCLLLMLKKSTFRRCTHWQLTEGLSLQLVDTISVSWEGGQMQRALQILPKSYLRYKTDRKYNLLMYPLTHMHSCWRCWTLKDSLFTPKFQFLWNVNQQIIFQSEVRVMCRVYWVRWRELRLSLVQHRRLSGREFAPQLSSLKPTEGVREAGRRKWCEREARGGKKKCSCVLMKWKAEVRDWGCRRREKIEEKEKKDGSLSHIACVAESIIFGSQMCVIHIKLSKLKGHLTPPLSSLILSPSPSLLPLSLCVLFYTHTHTHECTHARSHTVHTYTLTNNFFFFFFFQGNLLRGLIYNVL